MYVCPNDPSLLQGRAIRVDFAPPRNKEGSPGGGGRGRGGGREAGGRGGRAGGRGRGRGAAPTLLASKSKGTIAAGSASGSKVKFEE